MKHYYLILVFYLAWPNLHAQQIEFFGGANLNHFFEYPNEDYGRVSRYNYAPGFSFGLSLENLKGGFSPMRLSLKVEQYRGNLDLWSGGLAGGCSTDLRVNKSIIAVGFQPITFSPVNRLNINFGLEINVLLQERLKGDETCYQSQVGSWQNTYGEKSKRISNSMIIGLNNRIAYYCPLGNNTYFVPQFMFVLGLGNEFNTLREKAKSMRYYLGIGLTKPVADL